MEIHHRKEVLTLGDLILSVYDVCEEKKANVILWLAFNAGLVVLQGRQGLFNAPNTAEP